MCCLHRVRSACIVIIYFLSSDKRILTLLAKRNLAKCLLRQLKASGNGRLAVPLLLQPAGRLFAGGVLLAAGSQLATPQPAAADDNKRMLEVRFQNAFQKGAQKSYFQVCAHLPFCLLSCSGLSSLCSAALSLIHTSRHSVPQHYRCVCVAALQKRAETELRKVLSKEDTPAALRLVLHDAATYDIATGKGGPNGSIVLRWRRSDLLEIFKQARKGLSVGCRACVPLPMTCFPCLKSICEGAHANRTHLDLLT